MLITEGLEDREDILLLQEWLRAQEAGTADMISLDTLERELRDDGLLPLTPGVETLG